MASNAPGAAGASNASQMADFELRTTLLEKTCLVHISDGRAFKGNFVCVDSGRNVLLNNATEYKRQVRPVGAPLAAASLERQLDEYDRRFVGLVMIPGGHLVKLEVQAAMPSASFPADRAAYI